ncbi:MAG: copper resistance protein B [Desulfatiglandaceae bacterium]
MPEDYRSPAAPPPEGQEIRRYALDDPGTGATNFGLAPVHDNKAFYFFSADRFEYRATDDDGDLSFGLESEYDILLTQRLVLQPRLELGAAAQDVDAYGTAAGFTGIELGLRLRYEFHRKFAPYIGVSWESALGETANRIEDSGGDPDTTAFVAGVKFWF